MIRIKRNNHGYKVVLTADRTLMSHYNGLLFLGFSACVPKGVIPDNIYFSMFCPSIKSNREGSVKFAPCGTRKIEAALLNSGFNKEDIITAHPDHLDKVIGSDTKILSISGFDPLGIAPATTTFTQLLGGDDNYMSIKFEELVNHPSVKKYKPKIIVGGPGAWQFEKSESQEKLGLDCIVIGEGEKEVNKLFKQAINGESMPKVVHGEVLEEEEIPSIKKPTIEGIVEIARGCGRGCAFCVPTLQKYRCLPINHILDEVRVNLKAGKQPLLHAEDVLRYKANGFNVNKEAVIDLFQQVHDFPGVETVMMSHFALSSVASAPDLIEDISNILDADENNWLTGQTGIETGSPTLIRNTMEGKCKPFTPDEWPQVVVDAFQILSDNYWVPVGTVIIGLPGETETDVQLSINLIDELREFKSIVIPLFFVSEGSLNESQSFKIEDCTKKQCELLLRCWEHSLKWADVLLDQYFQMTNVNSLGTFGAKRIFAYGRRKSMELVELCENDYDYNLQEMLVDAENGEINIFPKPIQTIYNHFVI